ncbi:hypothetical protein VOLCADRAFT_96124 [Volvox carteri f. nagariensis]|uniref:Oxidoreductase-like domain-containing protein n=1 Tax=Volvox carteri f. nagariensis TaxID=3068 RepID=D8U9A0_VOLCA|nr:uncharacterized protein VOLCADRAFT_96124 [Volvox carteri f. nagariensis]EFJ43769.1 hypothetical protein VOLCADRAFT_96124 [Volvox carteri f. nagariensis]|eukprot:XP_002955250.1 hypothetical protein VOLCADRAFT_96124 [Volvox carteri f. nagariensis]
MTAEPEIGLATRALEASVISMPLGRVLAVDAYCLVCNVYTITWNEIFALQTRLPFPHEGLYQRDIQMIRSSVTRFRIQLPYQLHMRGISLPPKPTEPGPEECCQSGCNTCVWELYAEELANWKARVAEMTYSNGWLSKVAAIHPAFGSLVISPRLVLSRWPSCWPSFVACGLFPLSNCTQDSKREHNRGCQRAPPSNGALPLTALSSTPPLTHTYTYIHAAFYRR